MIQLQLNLNRKKFLHIILCRKISRIFKFLKRIKNGYKFKFKKWYNRRKFRDHNNEKEQDKNSNSIFNTRRLLRRCNRFRSRDIDYCNLCLFISIQKFSIVWLIVFVLLYNKYLYAFTFNKCMVYQRKILSHIKIYFSIYKS